ncbi:MAG: hypothetical protein FWF44_06270 [Defluviitaleaceae bacterium]|nr:hypothetical protein [Defluviitaleaceae bacterium]
MQETKQEISGEELDYLRSTAETEALNASRKAETARMMDQRQDVIEKIIRLIVNELEEPGKGGLTAMYTIGILKETIDYVEKSALMRAVRYWLKMES